MYRRKFGGIIIFILSISVFFIYAYLIMLSEWSPIVLQLSILTIIGGILGVVSWIGYVMATTKSSPSSTIQDDETKSIFLFLHLQLFGRIWDQQV